jgi:error-prone DNA polymerase
MTGVARYAELHCHTNFSFLDGASHPHELVARASELGYTALGVTDHDGFYGAVKVMEAARHLGMPVVYGVEIGLDRELSGDPEPIARAEAWDVARAARDEPIRRRGRSTSHHGTKPSDRKTADHLVLLAGSPGAYTVLSRLVTRAQMRGEKDRAVYSWPDLAEAASHTAVQALTGCWQGAVPRAAARGDLPGALARTNQLRDLFGERLHLEIWHHGVPGDDERNDLLWEVSRTLGVSTIATNQVHHAVRGDSHLADVLSAVAGRRDLVGANGYLSGTDERFLKSPAEMYERLGRYPGAVERAADLGSHLSFDLRLVGPQLPPFPMPATFGTRWNT